MSNVAALDMLDLTRREGLNFFFFSIYIPIA